MKITVSIGLILTISPSLATMEISNFISESERREVLYSAFDNRHKEIIAMFKKIKDENIAEQHIYTSLKYNGVSANEIG